MTNSGAVICEFNPMHLGHNYILQKAREHIGEDGCLIAVMSGNFTERCTPAVYNKYLRAHSAVLAGADLVVELPFPWCSSGVEDFALGGVSTAAGLCARSLTFGSESGEYETVIHSAEVKSSQKYLEAVRRLEREERSAGSAVIFSRAMNELGITNELGANDKLGVEYVINGKKYGIDDFNIIKRSADYSSAKQVREKIFEGGIEAAKGDILPEVYELYKRENFCAEKRYNSILFNFARMGINTQNPALVYAQKVADNSRTPDEFLKNLPQKKLTLARMRRELLFALLGVYEMNKKSPPKFTVLLAANERGREYLKSIKKSAGILVITKPSSIPKDDDMRTQYANTQAADKLYSLCIGEKADKFMKMRPVIL